MLRKLLALTAVALAATSLVGTAAATCQFGPNPAGYYTVCVLHYTTSAYPTYGFTGQDYSVVYASQAGPSGTHAHAFLYQFEYQYRSYSYGATVANVGGGAAGNNAGLGAYQHHFHQAGYDFQTTSANVGLLGGYVAAGQEVSNGVCTLFVRSSFAPWTQQPCGPVPAAPEVGLLPHL